MKKILALVLVALLALSMTAAMAAVPTPGTGTLTITNAAKGAEYKIWKVLSAEVGEKLGSDQPVVYTDDPIPEPLDTVLERVDTATAKDVLQYKEGKSASDLKTALDDWYDAHKDDTPTDSDTCSGNSITFTGLDFGYYIVKGFGDNLMMVSVTPEGTIYEKNTTIPEPEKTVEDIDYSIGDTIPYTVTFNAPNYHGTDEDAPIITKYVVSDTLPEFLSDTTVTKITIGSTVFEGDDLSEANFPGITTFATGKTFTIPWVDGEAPNYTSKYNEGSQIEIKYSATLTSTSRVGVVNTNTVSILPYDYTPSGEEPWEEPFQDDAEITTYAIALKKTDEDGNTLPGAKFKIKGLTVAETVSGTVGNYTVVSYDPNGADDSGTEMTTDDNGMLYIVGIDDDVTLTVTETLAPTGYNLLKESFEITPVALSTEYWSKSGKIYYDAKGNIITTETTETSVTIEKHNLDKLPDTAITAVVNYKGTELPSTGGIGTTIFYVGGGLLVLVAVIFLVTKRRMGSND